MNTSNDGLAIIMDSEGLVLKPYRCPANVPTIGYGSTYYEDGRPVSMSDPPITKARAVALLRQTLVRYERAVERYAQLELDQNEFDALVSLAYNIGNEALRTSTLLRKLNAGDIEGAANEFLRWNRGGGRVLPGLDKRRRRERALFLGEAFA